MKTLLIRSGGLGDTALSLFAAQWLSSDQGDDVTVMVQRRHMQVAELFGFDAVSEEDCDFQSAFSTPSSRLVDALKTFDTVIAIKKETGNLRGAFTGKLAQVSPLPPADCALPYPMFIIHGVARELGVVPPETLPRLEAGIKWENSSSSHCERSEAISPYRTQMVRDRHGRQGLPRDDISMVFQQPAGHLIFAIGSGSLAKNWPLHNFMKLVKIVKDNGFEKFTAIIGPVEMERDPGAVKSLAAIGGVCVLANPSIRELASSIAQGSVFVGADSGVTHLAALIGTPTVALFGPTDPVVWRPVGDCVTVIHAPSGRMGDIGVEKVFEAIANFQIELKGANEHG